MKIYLHLDTHQHWALLHLRGAPNNTPPTGLFTQKTGANEQQSRIFEMSRMARVDNSEDMPTDSEGAAKNPAKRIFAVEQEIELSNSQNFNKKTKVFFKHRDSRIPEGTFWGVDEQGDMQWGKYAREIAPKVMILLYLSVGTSQTRLISKQLADKILAGDV
jgi:hypothetical protein